MKTIGELRKLIRFLACALLALALGAGVGRPAPAEPPLTAEQRERLRERDRLAAESIKLWNAGKKAEAIAALKKQLAIEREVLGANHQDVIKSQHELDHSLEVLADEHDEHEQFDAARKVRREVLALRQALYEDKHWRVTDARLDLADTERLASFDAVRRARYWESQKLYAAVVDRYKKRHYADAVGLAQQVIAIRRDLLGKDHPAYARSLNSLAMLYEALGDYAKALPLHEEARAIRKKALGPDHPDYATGLNNLAALYRAMGDYPKALPLLKEASAILKKTRGPNHPDYARSLNNLASLYSDMGDYAKALPLHEEARAIRKKAVGTHHPDYAESLNNLASLYSDMGDYPKALPLLKEASAITK